MTEAFLYLGQKQPKKNWLIVPIFPSRRVEPEFPLEYNQVESKLQRIYLDELEETDSLEIQALQLIVADVQQTQEKALQLVNQTRHLQDNTFKERLVTLIATVLLYKLPNLTLEEIKEMFTLEDLKKSKAFQEIYAMGREEGEMKGKIAGIQEGKLEAIKPLLQEGFSVQKVAKILKLDIKVVQEVYQSLSDAD